MTDYRTFMDRARAGEYDDLDAAIDAEVERWHSGASHIYPDLHRHLGMTSVEYGAWVIAPDLLPRIVDGSFAKEAAGGMENP